MARGPNKHLKRVHAPKHWMLDKLGGVWAPRPSTGPHKLRECVPIVLLIRNRLKYALTGREANIILNERQVKVDGKVRTDLTFPCGFMDVITIDKTGDMFRLLYDIKGRFVLQRIKDKESKFKLCKVKRQEFGSKGVPYITTHDGRTIRYPDPDIKVNDTVKVDIEEGKIVDFVKFEVGNLVMITGGANVGRVGEIVNREKHHGSFEIIHVRDQKGHSFATRLGNVFVIGKGKESMITLPKGSGIKLSIIEEREKKLS